MSAFIPPRKLRSYHITAHLYNMTEETTPITSLPRSPSMFRAKTCTLTLQRFSTALTPYAVYYITPQITADLLHDQHHHQSNAKLNHTQHCDWLGPSFEQKQLPVHVHHNVSQLPVHHTIPYHPTKYTKHHPLDHITSQQFTTTLHSTPRP